MIVVDSHDTNSKSADHFNDFKLGFQVVTMILQKTGRFEQK